MRRRLLFVCGNCYHLTLMESKSFMRKTRTLIRFNALRNLVSDSMAIDMGSASTIISVRQRGVVIDEPSVVAVNKITGEVVAVGREARAVQGREARDTVVIAPLVDGVVADFERTQAMLGQFVRQARSGLSHFSRRAVMSVLSGVTQVEQRALLSAAEHAHIGRVYMVEEGLAAAIGAGVRVDEEHAVAVVDIGGSTTNVAVVANGGILYAHAERIGSSDIDAAIMDRLRRYRGLTIGVPTAERLKIELGSATEPLDPTRSMTVKGRDVQTGSPGAIDVTAGEIHAVAQPVIHKITEEVKDSLAQLQPEVAADIFDRGIILTGGGAQLEGLEQYLREATKLSVRVADEPRFATVRGLAQLFDEPPLLRRVARNEPFPLLDAEVFES
jgi:rod shape-determining protein MreB